MDNPDRVMGIDPSLTGFAMVVLGDNYYQRKQLKSTSTKWGKTVKGRIARYRYLVGSCLEFAEEHGISQFFIEGYSFGSQGASTVTLGEFGGVLRDRLLWRNNTVVEIAPTQGKKFATRKGNANKIAVVQAVAKTYGIFFEDDNLADAYIMARIGRVIVGGEAVANLDQAGVVNKLKGQYDEVRESTTRP